MLQEQQILFGVLPLEDLNTPTMLAFLSGIVGLNGVTITTLSRIGNSDSMNVTRRYIAIGV